MLIRTNTCIVACMQTLARLSKEISQGESPRGPLLLLTHSYTANAKMTPLLCHSNTNINLAGMMHSLLL